MSEENRTTLTGILWFLSAVVLGALFISAAAQGELTTGHLVFASVVLALAVAGTPYILRWPDSETQTKAKRQRIERLLRDMSDEELAELKQRLSDGDLGEETTLEQHVGDDGELVQRR